MTTPTKSEANEVAAGVSLQQYLVSIVDERDRKYDLRFANIERSLIDSSTAIKEALAAANMNLSAALASTEKAIMKAEAAVEKRFENVNEFRAQMGDMQTTLVRKSEVDIQFNGVATRLLGIEKTIEALTQQLALAAGRESGTSKVWSAIAVVITIVISVAAVVAAIVWNK